MDLLLFAGLAVGYAISTWELLRQSRLPRAPWETGSLTHLVVGSNPELPIVLRLHGHGGRQLAPDAPR